MAHKVVLSLPYFYGMQFEFNLFKGVFFLNIIHGFENSLFRFLLFCSNLDLQLSFLALVSYYNSMNF